MSTLTCRQTREGDQDVLRALRIAALTDAPEAFCSSLERESTRTDWDGWIHGSGTFLLEADGEPVGLVGGRLHDQDASRLSVESVWIRPDQRGRGGIRLLLDAVLDWGRGQGCREAVLHVGDRSPAARASYERHGFQATGEGFLREEAGVYESEMVRPLDEEAAPGG